MKIFNSLVALFFLLFLSVSSVLASSDIVWYGKDADSRPVIHLYFFWSKKCPHCLNALPDITDIDNEYQWLKLHSLELVDNPENIKIYSHMAAQFGNDARSVPAFMFCGNLLGGYDNKKTTGRLLRSYLQSCYQFAAENDPDNKTALVLNNNLQTSLDIPLLGKVSPGDYSLPMLTVLIAGMDAFNPCAFFVLLFLLSMMVHGRSRSRMALIGGVFVFFSSAIYFLFMAAWLNLFIFLGELRVMTLIAGGIAVFIAAVNIKDYFWFKKGFSLSISENEKPRLIDRIRKLLRMESMTAVLAATIVLAIVANSYELLCTAGFPMVYTRILTLNVQSAENYYLYLLLYNLVYIIPLLVIVVVFTLKLGSRKLSEREGMALKLLSGVMMLLLGVLLLVSPQSLNNVVVAAALLILSVAITWGVTRLKNNQ